MYAPQVIFLILIKPIKDGVYKITVVVSLGFKDGEYLHRLKSF